MTTKKPKFDPLIPIALSMASAERPECVSCGLFATCSTPFTQPFIPDGWTGELLVIGEALDGDDDARKLLRKLWKVAGYQDNDVALVDSIRCRPGGNATPSMRSVRNCRPFLLRVVERLKARFIVGCGGTALRSITNSGNATIAANRRRPIAMEGLPGVVATVTYDPRAVLGGAVQYRDDIVDDLRAARQGRIGYPAVEIPAGFVLGIDTEFEPDGTLVTVGLASKTKAVAFEGDDWLVAKSQLADARVVVGHSIHQDLVKLAVNDFPIREDWLQGRDVMDSLLLARMGNENKGKGGYKLESLVLETVPVEPWKHRTELFSESDIRLWPQAERLDRCRLDAWAACMVAEQYYRTGPLVEMTHRIAATIERMNTAGAIVDGDAFARYAGAVGHAKDIATDLLTKQAGRLGMEAFKVSNDGHIREALFGRLSCEVLGTTATGLPKVDKQTLLRLVRDERTSEDGKEFLARLIEANRHAKQWDVNVVGLGTCLWPRLRIDPSEAGDGTPSAYHARAGDGAPDAYYLPHHINPLGARTGRRASSNPNSQNWPKAARQVVRSRWPGGRIGAFDYKKLEVVILAWVIGDDKLLSFFSTGNGYIDVAKEMLGYEVAEGTPEYRAIKVIILGSHYNMQPPRMARQLEELGILFSADWQQHVKETAKRQALYFRRFSKIQEYMDRQRRFVWQHGYVDTLVGRRRHLPISRDLDPKIINKMENQAINFPIQGLAGEVTGSALVDTESALLREAGLSYRDWTLILAEWERKCLTQGPDRSIILPISTIFNEVHDEVTVDLHPDHHERDVELVVETMRSIPSLRALAPTFDLKLDVDPIIRMFWHGTER